MSSRPGSFVSRHRFSLVIALGLLAALAVVVLLGGGAQTSTELDPDNPGPDGAQALARVLEDQDVDVTVARDADSLESSPVGADTTVVVTSTQYLGSQTTERDRSPGLFPRKCLIQEPIRCSCRGGW